MREFIEDNPRLFAFMIIMMVTTIVGGSIYGCQNCIAYQDRKNEANLKAKEACLKSGGEIIAPGMFSGTQEQWFCKR